MFRRFCLAKKNRVLIGLAVAAFVGTAWAMPSLIVRYDRYRGVRALQSRQNTVALDWLHAAEKIDGDDSTTQFLLARSCRRLARFDDMNRHLQQAARLGFPGRRIERERLLAVAQTGRVREIERRLTAMLSDAGDDGPEICAALVDGLNLSFDLELANVVLEGWIREYPRDPEPYYLRGELSFGGGEWPEAIAMLQKCLELAPDRVPARLRLAQCLVKMHDPIQAELQFRQCVMKAPENLEAWTGLGTCLMINGRPDDAQSALLHVTEQDPRHFEARKQLGELELSRGAAQEAIRWTKPLVENWPDDKALCNLMAQALQETGETEQAQAYRENLERSTEALRRVDELVVGIRDNPTDVDLRYELGTLLMQCQSREDGVKWLQSLLRFDAHHPGAHRALADYYEKCGEEILAGKHRQLAESAGEVRRVP
jgi:predicted Zn-dependent protease